MADRKWESWHSGTNALIIDWDAVIKVFSTLPKSTDDVAAYSLLPQLENIYDNWFDKQQALTPGLTKLDYKEIHKRVTRPPKSKYPDWSWLYAIIEILQDVPSSRWHFTYQLQSIVVYGPTTTVTTNWSVMFSTLPNELLGKFNTLRDQLCPMHATWEEDEYLWELKRQALYVIGCLETTSHIFKEAMSLPSEQVIGFFDRYTVEQVLDRTILGLRLSSLSPRSRVWKQLAELLADATAWLKQDKVPFLYGTDDSHNRSRVCLSDACLRWLKSSGQEQTMLTTKCNWNSLVDLLIRASNSMLYGSYGRVTENTLDAFMHVVLMNSKPSEELAAHLMSHSPINNMLALSTETV